MRAAVRGCMRAGIAAALLALGADAGTQTLVPPPPTPPGPLACLILPDRSADLGTATAGVVESIAVERGELVRRGQVLARLRVDVEPARPGIVKRGAGTASAPRARSAARVLRSPFDGVVVDRYANPGERIEDTPLLRVAAIHPLRVEVVAPMSWFGRFAIGQDLSVLPELGGARSRSARITQIDRVLDPNSNSFRLRLALPNPDFGLPAGLRCVVDMGRPRSPAAAPGTASVARPSAAHGMNAPASGDNFQGSSRATAPPAFQADSPAAFAALSPTPLPTPSPVVNTHAASPRPSEHPAAAPSGWARAAPLSLRRAS